MIRIMPGALCVPPLAAPGCWPSEQAPDFLFFGSFSAPLQLVAFIALLRWPGHRERAPKVREPQVVLYSNLHNVENRTSDYS